MSALTSRFNNLYQKTSHRIQAYQAGLSLLANHPVLLLTIGVVALLAALSSGLSVGLIILLLQDQGGSTKLH